MIRFAFLNQRFKGPDASPEPRPLAGWRTVNEVHYGMKREPRRPWAGDFPRRRSLRHKKPSSRLGNLPINVARGCRGTGEGGKSSFAPTAIVGVRTFSRALLGVKNRAWRRRVFCGSPVHRPPETGGGLETLSIKNPQKSFTPSLNSADRRCAGVSGDRRGGKRRSRDSISCSVGSKIRRGGSPILVPQWGRSVRILVRWDWTIGPNSGSIDLTIELWRSETPEVGEGVRQPVGGRVLRPTDEGSRPFLGGPTHRKAPGFARGS